MVRLLVVCAINKADRLVVHRVFIISGRRSRRHEKLLKIVVYSFFPATISPEEGLFLPPRQKVPVEAIIGEIARVAFGLWLVLGSKGLTAAIKRIGGIGQSASTSE